MDWENERYVRLYTRDSSTWLLWPWQARAVFALLLRKVDRAGVMDIGTEDPIEAVAVHVNLPVEVVDVGLAAILKKKTAVLDRGRLVIPNFMEAQEAKSSDAQRQRDSRERRRALRLVEEMAVTSRDTQSLSGTNGHDWSQPVTPSLAKPSQAKPSQGVQGDPEDVADAPPPRAKRVAARRVSKFRPKTRAREIFGQYEQQRAATLGGNVTQFTDDHYRVMQQTVRYIQQERACDPKAAWEWLDQFGKAAIEEAASPEHSPEWAEKLRRWRTGPQAWAKKRYQAVMSGVDGGGGINGRKPKVRQDESTGEYFILKNGVRYECDENGQVIVHG